MPRSSPPQYRTRLAETVGTGNYGEDAIATLHASVLRGTGGQLESIRWRPRGGQEIERPIRHLFLFIGAAPNTDWLSGTAVQLDDKGFFEMHIEQGTQLEQSSLRIGVVTGIVAIWQWHLRVQGQQDHAGGTTMAERRDALAAFVRQNFFAVFLRLAVESFKARH